MLAQILEGTNPSTKASHFSAPCGSKAEPRGPRARPRVLRPQTAVLTPLPLSLGPPPWDGCWHTLSTEDSKLAQRIWPMDCSFKIAPVQVTAL